MPQVLIVEDDFAIAHTLLFTFQNEGWDTVWANSMREGMSHLVAMDKLSVIVLDIGLPDGTGLDFCHKVRTGAVHSQAPIVFLTAKHEEIERIVGLEMGADDYITKPFSPREVVARIKAIWRRQAMSGEDTSKSTLFGDSFSKELTCGYFCYSAHNFSLSLNDNILPLSRTELALMLALLKNPTHILSREQLLVAISDHPEHRLARTIDAHIKSLRQKLSAVSAKTIITTHRGLGYGLS